LGATPNRYIGGPAAFIQTLGVAMTMTTELHSGLSNLQRAEDLLISRGMVALTQTARRGGTEGILTELASLIDGWAALIDRFGKPIAVTGAARIHIDDATTLAMNKSRTLRNTDMQLHSVGRPEDPRAFLVVSSRRGSESRIRELSSQAASLMDLTFFAERDGRVDEIARTDVVDVLLSGSAPLAKRLANRWGLRSENLCVVVLRSRSRAVMLERIALEWLAELEVPRTLRSTAQAVTIVISPEVVPAFVEKLEIAAAAGVPVRCGIGRPTELGQLSQSLRQAQQALDIAVSDGKPAIQFETLPLVDLVLRNLSPVSLGVLSDPIRLISAEENGALLLNSLKVFLAENGSWEAAASQLGVHRHTLKNRITKIEELTSLSMMNAEDRFRAWLAILSNNSGTESPVT
jgi:purine catabolism regulator